MQYMLLIYDREADWEAMSEAERGKLFGLYREFSNAIQAEGKFLAGNALEPVATATTLRVRDGKSLTSDGPFAETKEQLGGYYLVEAKDLDEALAIAARIPSARIGCVEVRPVMRMTMPG